MWDLLSVNPLQSLDLSFKIQGSIQMTVIINCKIMPDVSLKTTLGEGKFSTYT